MSVFALIGMVAGTTVAMADSSSTATSGYTTISVTDGKDYVAPGGSLLYVVTLSQNAGPVGYADLFLTLPPYTNTVYPDHDGRVVGNRVIWDRVAVSQGERKIFTVSVNLGNNIPEDTALQAVAQVGSLQSSDFTTVRGRTPVNTFRISVTDKEDQVYPGETQRYTITVKNTSSMPVRSDVTANVSALNSIDSTSAGASVSYPVITWKDVAFEPNEEKIFSFNATMRKRMSPYTAARVIARVASYTATDTTVARDLHGDPTFMVATLNNGITSVTSRGTSSRTISSSSSSKTYKSVLFRNVADAGDVVPGGTIRYTVYVQNVLLNVIRDAVVTERFDPSLVTIVDAGNGTIVSPGVIQWTLPALRPGQEWKQSYSVRVSPTLKNGTVISSVATISGNDVAFATMTEKATVTTTSVVGNLPTTGGAFDLLFTLATAPLAMAGAALQRKRK